MTETEFTRQFWNDKFAELNKINQEMPDVAETLEDFISQLDDISIEYNVSAFGYDEREKGMPGVRASMEVDLGPGKNFLIDINADAKLDNNTRVKSTYMELSLLHENGKEFLTNTFFPFLPYTVLQNLLETMANLEQEYSTALLNFRKAQKLNQITIATIKGLLKVRFENTRFDWYINEFSTGNYVITLSENGKEISRIIVDDDNCTQKILEWQI